MPGAGLDEDEESVCSSLDGSILSDEGEWNTTFLVIECVCGGYDYQRVLGERSMWESRAVCVKQPPFIYAVVSENGDESPDSELELQFLLHDRIEQLTDKKSV